MRSRRDMACVSTNNFRKMVRAPLGHSKRNAQTKCGPGEALLAWCGRLVPAAPAAEGRSAGSRPPPRYRPKPGLLRPGRNDGHRRSGQRGQARVHFPVSSRVRHSRLAHLASRRIHTPFLRRLGVCVLTDPILKPQPLDPPEVVGVVGNQDEPFSQSMGGDLGVHAPDG